MNQRTISDNILQLQAKGDVFTRQLIIEQRRVDDINGVSSAWRCTCIQYDLGELSVATSQ